MIKSFEIRCIAYSITADLYEGHDASKVLLILPGYESTRERQKEVTTALVEQTGASALVIDYSGHGDSPFALRDTRPAQHLLEVVCAFDWLRATYPSAEITVIGSSYGSFLAAHLSNYRIFKNLVLRAPAIYRPNTLYDLWSIRIDNEATYRPDMEQYRQNVDELRKHPLLIGAANFNGRTLVVIHEYDEIVPSQTTDAYIKAFNADMYVAEGFMHAVSQSEVTKAQLNSYHGHIATWLIN